MNERDLRRIYGKKSTKNEDSLVKEVNKYLFFSEEYKVKSVVDYDAIIIISSYNRYDNLIYLINQIINTETQYTYKIIVLDDGSETAIDLSEYPDIILMNNENNYGKYLYWKSMTKLFNESSKFLSHCVIQIDDDFILTNNFLNKVIPLFFAMKKENNKYVAIKCHLSDAENDSNRWGYNGNWIDGGGLYDSDFINIINTESLSISSNRWKFNPKFGSGVWQKISGYINTNKLLIYCPEVSYMKHAGNENSMMNPEERKNNIINTYNFDCNE